GRFGALDPFVNGHYFWELPDGVAQLCVRDPSGNLIEVNACHASVLPVSVREDIRGSAARPESGRSRPLDARFPAQPENGAPLGPPWRALNELSRWTSTVPPSDLVTVTS